VSNKSTPRRGIKNDSIDIIELSKGFQPIAIVLISKKRKLCLSLSIDGQFTVIHYPSIPSYNYLIVKGFDRKKKCLCWELNSNAFHGFIVKFKGFRQAEISSQQQLYAQGMINYKEFPDSKFIHLTPRLDPLFYHNELDWLTSKSPVLPLPPKIQKVGTLFRHVSRFCAVERL